MAFLLFLAATIIGGVLFVINGVSVLLGDCAAVAFDDSRRIGGRSFFIRATCLSEQQAVASDVPTWMGGWGLILLGFVSIFAFVWLTPLLGYFARRKAIKQANIQHSIEVARQQRIAAYGADLTPLEIGIREDDARLSGVREAAAIGQGLNTNKFLLRTIRRTTRRRVAAIALATLSAILPFLLAILLLPLSSDGPSVWMATLGFAMALAAGVVLTIDAVISRRYLGRWRRVAPDTVWGWMAFAFAALVTTVTLLNVVS